MEKRERKPNENIQVFVRLRWENAKESPSDSISNFSSSCDRPSNAREKAIRSMEMVEVSNSREVVLRNNTDTKLNKKFVFDRAFGPESKQVNSIAKRPQTI